MKNVIVTLIQKRMEYYILHFYRVFIILNYKRLVLIFNYYKDWGLKCNM